VSDDLKAYEVLERAIENEKALLRDRAIYGTSFVDEEGQRIDPKTLEPWCDFEADQPAGGAS
jgi:hypothetical protein